MRLKRVGGTFYNLRDAFCEVPMHCMTALHRSLELIRDNKQEEQPNALVPTLQFEDPDVGDRV